ncbi:MAG: YtxH domain-containing protein [Clostridiaceae bacterium]
MQNGFIKGVMVGGIIAASVSMMMTSDMVKPRTKKRMMRNGRSFLRKSSSIIGDVADMFR